VDGENDYTGGDGGTGTNPAWNEVLSAVPQEFHDKLTPHFQKWDQGVNDRFAKVHSEYESWKPLKEAGIDPNDAQFGVNLLKKLADDPKAVYEAIGNHYQFNQLAAAGQGQGSPIATPEKDDVDPYAERFAQYDQAISTLAGHNLAKLEAEREVAADAQLDRELNEAKKKHGDFDEAYVLSHMDRGVSIDEAVKAYRDLESSFAKKYGQTPLFMTGTGGVPSSNIDPRKLDEKGARNYATQMVQQMIAESRK
jgi:hypothetical protein